MLVATSHRTFAGSSLRTTIYLERRLRAHVIVRDRLLFDTRFSPPAKRGESFVHLYASLAGTFQVAGGAAGSEPQLWALAETEFDRVQPSARTFRSFGGPSRVVEIRFPARDVLAPIGLGHGSVALPAAAWDAYHAFVAGTGTLVALIDRLAAAGIIRDLAPTIVADEPEHFARLWATLRPLYEQYATSASLKQISTLAGLSLRQLGRDLTDLTRTFGLFGAGFRDAMRVLRLRAAVLFLSAPDGTPTEVAREVGYGSLDAMARAFRDAKLPAPSVVQDGVRYPGY